MKSNILFICTIILGASLADAKNVFVPRENCLIAGGQVAATKRNFVCLNSDGTYDWYLTEGPQTVYECNQENQAKNCLIQFDSGKQKVGKCYKEDNYPTCVEVEELR